MTPVPDLGAGVLREETRVATKMCIECGICNKAPKLQRCWECWLAKQPIETRELWAAWRLQAVPEGLRIARVPQKDWPPGRRWCASCQTFVRLKDCGKKATQCKTCVSTKAHGAMVERTYNITAAEYALLFRAQNGRCYICHERPRSKRLAVDHDHKTGLVRGLLCADNEWGCNYALLGKIKDLAMAERLVEYLRRPPAFALLDQES